MAERKESYGSPLRPQGSDSGGRLLGFSQSQGQGSPAMDMQKWDAHSHRGKAALRWTCKNAASK